LSSVAKAAEKLHASVCGVGPDFSPGSGFSNPRERPVNKLRGFSQPLRASFYYRIRGFRGWKKRTSAAKAVRTTCGLWHG
jgi:hypothetical protein